MIDDAGVDEEIPLPNVKKSVFSKIEQFCIHLRTNPLPDIEKPLKSANFADVTSPWFANFVELDQDMLFELIMAANYLDMKPLLDLACAKVASQIKNKSVKEIRQFFNIENDFTPEEE
ncbi:MAG: SKP1 family protein [Flammeovirgaceae bacterium]